MNSPRRCSIAGIIAACLVSHLSGSSSRAAFVAAGLTASALSLSVTPGGDSHSKGLLASLVGPSAKSRTPGTYPKQLLDQAFATPRVPALHMVAATNRNPDLTTHGEIVSATASSGQSSASTLTELTTAVTTNNASRSYGNRLPAELRALV
jgi:hypothetical protein